MNAATGAKMTASPLGVHYVIDTARSRFTVKVSASGLLSFMGHNPTIAIRDFRGELILPPDSLEGASMEFSVNARSLAVQDEISDKDKSEIEQIMQEQVLEVDHFPEIKFTSWRVSGTQLGAGLYQAAVEGDLSLHGVTRTLGMKVQVVLLEETLHAYGEFPLQQTDFDIALVSIAGGTLRVKNELKLSFDILARKQG